MPTKEDLEKKAKMISEHVLTEQELEEFSKTLYNTSLKIMDLRKAREVPEWKEEYMKVSPIHHLTSSNYQADYSVS